MKVSAGKVRQQILNILLAWGMEEGMATTTAELMVETDLFGVDSHGISMLMIYERGLREGRLQLRVKPRVVREGPSFALLDAMAGLGHPVSAMAMNLAVDKAQQTGIACVGVRNSHHFGAAGVYARIAAQRDMLGMVATGTRGVFMVPPGGAMPILGTNPLAFAAPAGRNRPFVLDMATTTIAAGKVKVYDLNEKPMPPGWVVDGTGRSVTDAAEGQKILHERQEGGLTPLGGLLETGGHKGYGLAMMVHILGATLVGGSFSPIRNRTQKPGDPDDLGHFFMAIDPKLFRDDGEFQADLDDVIDELHALKPADPSRPVLVAGDPEEQARAERLENGIPIPEALDRHVRGICERSGAAYVLT